MKLVAETNATNVSALAWNLIGITEYVSQLLMELSNKNSLVIQNRTFRWMETSRAEGIFSRKPQ